MTSPMGMQPTSAVTPEAKPFSSSSSPSPEDMLDMVVMEVMGATKYSKVKAILDENEMETLVELAMHDCDELAKLQGSVPIPSVPAGFETVSLTKTQAKKLSLLKQWYMSQPNASSTTWLKLTKDELDAFIMGNQSTSVFGTPDPTSPTSSSSPPPAYTSYAENITSTQGSLLANFNKSIKRSVGD